ncbi:formate dehydrogenase major subunit [Marinobacter sp. DSM 26671]|jgi:formate dehydrogenase major subunit|uniref:formate dehydrogenase subunit alpha n=1 Tax=unclassified Marinobacter TaxID=83889 RepID=UPI0008EBFD46|nr:MULTISPECIES: formate dehydrogenase subunit alpha [unclassified Marinobacter]MCP4062137.1 formate dehydrogenase subunit alpha [Gammaproteobacteria bacterium]MAK51792.1 formate dehydrogenase [Marinobacter sp.]MBI45894.1 formate dehydrogenase [Marinobacter sp.]MTI78435.1 formate dehydrogenase [Marinobacter sp.]SFE30976.1 formate dehydrogenase major subunit [Marinobacter sp. DSM 26671]|tara:strand:+ start:1688 stop:4573 length:2886 start_codon:yes stop_codon:yes gene_type:complete
MLRKKTNGVAKSSRAGSLLSSLAAKTLDRRQFLTTSGVAVGGLAALSLSSGRVEAAAPTTGGGEVVVKKSVCTHCSVGCTVEAEVQNGTWIGQEPGWDSPFNLGAHCAKGASVREHAHGERRLKSPMKMVNGQWQKISWDTAINEIGDKMLEIREQSGPDSVYWLGSAKFNNEQAYLFRKFAAYWGTNNVDHQARICHSTTVAGVANTWGYGAMTNSYNDIHNSKAIFIIGGNPAEAHPVSLLHVLKAKEENNAPLIVCDPRFTRTAAHADEFVRFRPGSDVALVWGILWHIFENGWEDKEFIRTRVWGMDEIREEVKRWNPEEVERVTGAPGAQLERVARTLVNNRPGTVIWCMGGTQHTNGNNNTRAYCILQLALGNMGVAGGGTNIFRGHDNVQGATDLGVLADTLPGYYGLSAGAWAHWSRVWEEDLDYLKGRFAVWDKNGKSKAMMNEKGIPVSRWIDGVLEAKENLEQPDNTRAMVLWGHAPNSQTRMTEMKEAMEKLDLLVVVDPFPTVSAVLHDRKEGAYLLPTTTQFETYGSVTASNRSLQWREKVVEPLFDSKVDHEIMKLFADKFGFTDRMFRNIAIDGDEPSIEDITREFNRGMWTIGYTGQSPERLKKHMKYQHHFDKTTLRAVGGPCDGDFYGLPWPSWGTPEMNHPGTANLYDMSLPVSEGGLTFRARFGVERDGESLLADGVYSKNSEIKDGYPEFTMQMLMDLGWDGDLTAEERASIEAVAGPETNWKTDLSGGIQRVAIKHECAPFGNAKARTVVWNFPDPIPLHREPLYTNRRDLVKDYPTYEDKTFWRVPTLYESIQKNDFSKEFPIILTSGRLVEYEGGGDETRSNPWLAELQQEMFIEVNPRDANNLNIRDGNDVWVSGPEGARIKVKAMVTERVGEGVAFMPFHFGGHYQGKDLRDKYPKGADPIVLGESTNTVQTYGYDSVTQMQETKATLCSIMPA